MGKHKDYSGKLVVSNKQNQAFHEVWHTTTINFMLTYRHRTGHKQKHVANTEWMAESLSQQYCLSFLVTTSWEPPLRRVFLILKSKRSAYITVHSNSQSIHSYLHMNISMNICFMQHKSQAGHQKLPFCMSKHLS